MRAEHLAVLRDDEPGLVERIAEARRAGAVPLVGDARWPAEQWAVVHRVAREAGPLPGVAWASLTSGTTSRPRIVLRSAESWSRSFPLVERLLDAGADDVVALTAPASSSLTLFSIAHALGGGPRAALAPPPSIDAALAEATRFHGTPQGLARLLDIRARTGAGRGIRVALVGGSRLDAALRERAARAGIRVVAYYGAAELSFVAVDEGLGLRAAEGVELEARDAELWARSPFAAAGYLVGEGLRGGPLRRDERGFASVGDRARIDPASGVVTLLGRRDGAILTASATVVPEEVEDALRGAPGIADLAVLGVPTAGIGALVVAVLEPADDGADVDARAGAPLTASALRALAAERLTAPSRPRRWFAGELPRTPSGKIARGEVARRLAEGGFRAIE